MKEITHIHIYSVFHWAASLMSSLKRTWNLRIYFVITIMQVSHHVTSPTFLPLFYPSPHLWDSLSNWLLCGFHWALKPPPWRTIPFLWALLGPHIDNLKFPSMSSRVLSPLKPLYSTQKDLYLFCKPSPQQDTNIRLMCKDVFREFHEGLQFQPPFHSPMTQCSMRGWARKMPKWYRIDSVNYSKVSFSPLNANRFNLFYQIMCI